MTISFAIVGPGRLGAALARRWHDAGLRFVGFHGRDASRVADAVAFVGAGRALSASELGDADVVGITVSDRALAGVVAALARAGAPREGTLWLHTSGAHGLAPLAAIAAAGARIGTLHPLAPVPDRETGVRSLAGRNALLEGPSESLELLRSLAEHAGLRAVEAGGPVDRALYHAACALAANGTTALLGVAEDLLAAAARVGRPVASALAGDLAAAASTLVAERGAAAALSGPVLRGDDPVVRSHLGALGRGPRPDAVPVYRAVMRGALSLARARGLAPDAAARIEAVLDGEDRA